MSTKTSQSKNNKKGINNVICAILAFIIGFVGTFAGYFFVEAPKDEQVSETVMRVINALDSFLKQN